MAPFRWSREAVADEVAAVALLPPASTPALDLAAKTIGWIPAEGCSTVVLKAMALADNCPLGLMASTKRLHAEVAPMNEPHEQQQPSTSLITATAWAAAALAAIAVAGMLLAQSLRAIWIILLMLAVAAVPQAVLHLRRERRAQVRGERR